MTYLILDTSSDHAVLVLAGADGGVLAATLYEGRRTLSRRLMSVMDGLLLSNGLRLGDLDGLGVGVGPGSFTGLRVGLTTMKTLAQVTGLPLVGVDTAAAYAHGISAANVYVATPSRRNEVYTGLYRSSAGAPPERVGALRASTYADLAREVAAGAADVSLTSSATEDIENSPVLCGPQVILDAVRSSVEFPLRAIAVARSWPSAAGLAKLAALRLTSGDTDDPLALVPCYIVPPAISTPRAALVAGHPASHATSPSLNV